MNAITDGLGALNDGTEAAQRLLEIAKEVKGCFAYFKSMPSVALVKMNKVFKEVGDTVNAVSDVIDRYLELGLDSSKIDEDPKVLIDLSGSGLRQMIEEKRGHCSTIGGIRYEYLDGWFDKLRNDYPKESKKIDTVFDELSYADTDLFDRLAEVATYIQSAGEL